MDVKEPLEAYVVRDAEQAVVLLNPLRTEILSHLREPVSAAEIARKMNETPQRINYHLKALEKVGLARKTGTRQVRNLVEVLYQAIAKTFVLSEALGLEPEAMRRMKDDSSLAHLVSASEKIRRDALRLMERTESGTAVPSASLSATVYLAEERERHAFVEEYVELVRRLTEKYQASADGGAGYRVMLAVYPEPEEGEA